MERTRYVGEGPEAKALIDEAIAKIDAFIAIAENISKAFPNNKGGIHKGSRGKLLGVAIDGEHKLSPEQCKELGVNPNPEMVGKDFFYKPDKRTKAGKDLTKCISAANQEHIDFSDFIVERLGVSRMLFRYGRMFRAVSGHDKDKLFVSIPGAPDDGEEHDKFPAVPTWLRKPEGDEYAFFLR